MKWNNTKGIIISLSLFSPYPLTSFSFVDCAANPFRVPCSPIPAPTNDSQKIESQKENNQLIDEQNGIYSFINQLEAWKSNNLLNGVLQGQGINSVGLEALPFINTGDDTQRDTIVSTQNSFKELKNEISHSSLSVHSIDVSDPSAGLLLSLGAVQNFATMQKSLAFNDASLFNQNIIFIDQDLISTDMVFAVSDLKLSPIKKDYSNSLTYTSYDDANALFMELYRNVSNFADFSNDYLSFERYNLLNPKLEGIIEYHEALLQTQVQLTEWFEVEIGRYLDTNAAREFIYNINIKDKTTYPDNLIRRQVGQNVTLTEMVRLLEKIEDRYPRKDNMTPSYPFKCFSPKNYISSIFPDTRFQDLDYSQILYPSLPTSVGIWDYDDGRRTQGTTTDCYFHTAKKSFEFLEIRKLEEWWKPFREGAEIRLANNIKIQQNLQNKWQNRLTLDELINFRKSTLSNIHKFPYQMKFPIVKSWMNDIQVTEGKLDYLTIGICNLVDSTVNGKEFKKCEKY